MHDPHHNPETDAPNTGGGDAEAPQTAASGPDLPESDLPPTGAPQPDLPDQHPETISDPVPDDDMPGPDAPPVRTGGPRTRPVVPQADGDRIAKIMARAGVASRRDAERMILEGRVRVNGSVIRSPALDIRSSDKVEIDGQPLDAPQPTRVWLYYKPVGLVTSESDEKGRQTIFDALPRDLPRVMTIGRLDLTSEGLLLLTNDGELKRRLELPSTGWMRRYRVRVNGHPNQLTFEPLRRGALIDGEQFQPMEIEMDSQQGANAWLTVGIREGKNREIRRAMNHVGLMVNRLIRVSYGPFRVTGLDKNEVREVKRRVLRDQLGNLLTGEPDAPDGDGHARPQRGTDPAERPRRPRPDSRPEGGERPARYGDKGPRPGGFKPRTDGDRPARPESGERPARYGDKGPRPGGFKPRTDGDRSARPEGGERPARYGDKGPRTGGFKPRTDGDRPARPESGERPARYGDKGPRPGGFKPRTDGDRPARPEGSERPARYGDKGPQTGGFKQYGGGDRPPRPEGGERPTRYGDKGPRPGGFKPRADSDRPARPEGSERPARYGDKGPRPGQGGAGQARGPRPGGSGGFGGGPRSGGGAGPRGPRPGGPSGPRKPQGNPGR